MQIAITGTSGTGKSTLATALAQRLSLKVIQENWVDIAVLHKQMQTARNIGEPDIAQQAINRYLESCELWLKQRSDARKSCSDLVADRFCFDILRSFVSSRLEGDGGELIRQCLGYCIEESRHYDLVIVCPISGWSFEQKTNQDQLIRNKDPFDRLRSQSLAIGLLEQFCAAPRLLINDRCETVEQRVELVCDTLKQLGKL